MVWIEDILFCDGCGTEISWSPVAIEDRYYCCQDCAEGRECECAERKEWEEDMRSRTAPEA